MQDLNVINKLNNEAVQRDIPNQLAAGKHVVAEYAGLHFIGSSAFDTLAEAEARKKSLDDKGIPGNRAEILSPAA